MPPSWHTEMPPCPFSHPIWDHTVFIYWLETCLVYLMIDVNCLLQWVKQPWLTIYPGRLLPMHILSLYAKPNPLITIFWSILCAYSRAHKSWRHTVEQYLYDFNKSKKQFLFFFLHWKIYEENLENWKTYLKDKSGHSDGCLICALTQLALLIKYDIVAKMQNSFLECSVFNSFPLTL